LPQCNTTYLKVKREARWKKTHGWWLRSGRRSRQGAESCCRLRNVHASCPCGCCNAQTATGSPAAVWGCFDPVRPRPHALPPYYVPPPLLRIEFTHFTWAPSSRTAPRHATCSIYKTHYKTSLLKTNLIDCAYIKAQPSKSIVCKKGFYENNILICTVSPGFCCKLTVKFNVW